MPIADMHSHYGLITRKLADSGFADDLRTQGVALVAWKHVADGRWIRGTRTGIEQYREPAPGDVARFFNERLRQMQAYASAHKLRVVLTRADVDACVRGYANGEAGVVLACEGADFLEGRVEELRLAYEQGLRHLQFVHYIRTPVGDFQTAAPVHNGFSDMGKQLIEACNTMGVLVDLAHSTGAGVDQALEIAKAPVIWSHGWVDTEEGTWRDGTGLMRRRLSLAHAKKIASRGGVIGLWGLGSPRPAVPGRGWSVGARDTQGYARELASLVNKIGADHVALGTDIEGVGSNWSVNSYGDVRQVIKHLEGMKLGTAVIERVAYVNYAHVLKASMAT
jgi:membrane dipeptidase